MSSLTDQMIFLQDAMSAAISSADSELASLPVSQSFITPAIPQVAATNISANVVRPDIAAPAEFQAELLSRYPVLEAWASSTAQGLLTNFFPAISSGLMGAPDDWIVRILDPDQLNDANMGLGATAEQAMWVAGRDRATSELVRAEDDAAASISSRGFRMPAGAVLRQMRVAKQAAQTAYMQTNATITQESARIKVDLQKTAAALALEVKQRAAATFIDMIKVFATFPALDAEVFRSEVSGYAAYYDALSRYYDINFNYSKINLEAGRYNQQNATQVAALNQESQRFTNNLTFTAFNSIEDRLSRQAVSAAQVYGQIAASAISSLSSIVIGNVSG